MHFVRNGCQLPDWLPYTAETPNVRLLHLKDQMVKGPDQDRYAAWAGRDVGPGLTTTLG